MNTTSPEYRETGGESVQVLARFAAYPDCRACGGDGYVESGECRYCSGGGKELTPVEFARVGYLSGPRRGEIGEVTAASLVAPSGAVERERTWIATVSVAGQERPAPLSVGDTLRSQTALAVAEARALIEQELGSDAAVVLYKTTKARGTERHSSVYVYRDDRDGSIKTQR
jgi:hypothetical protein